jgi:phosphate-selective porin OprO and OprP
MFNWNVKRCPTIASVILFIVSLAVIPTRSPAEELSGLKLGGRMMNDFAWMSPEDDVKAQIGDFTNGSEFRRIWLNTSGTVNGNMDFVIQLDFTNSVIKFKNVYVTFKGLPVTVKAGHIKEPFSLDGMTSSKYLTFMERALPSLFSPGWNNGVQFSSSAYNQRLSWAAGVFGNTANDGYSNT